MITFKTKPNDVNRTLFKFLIKMLADVPISRLEKVFRKKDVKVNGQRINQKSYKLQLNDLVVVYGIASEPRPEIVKTNVTFSVVFEDEQILIVAKPINISMYGEANSLDQQVLTYLQYKPTDSFTPTHVGRLDKVTSGLCLYAKTYQALVEMNAKNHFFDKIYMLRSDLNQDLTVEYKIAHDELKQRMVVAPYGTLTKTKFFQLDHQQFAQILTGKKHQIRVSLSKLGKPIYGDTKYGGKRAARVFLHCYRLTFHQLEGPLSYLNEETIVRAPKKWS